MEIARGSPSEECKKFMIECIIAFYESETTLSLDNKYIRYQEECVLKFKTDMKQMLLNALNVRDWWEETEKNGFNKCLDNKVHDALWNSKVILTKYGRQYRPNDAGFEEVVLKADLFRSRCAPFAKSHNRIGSIAWWKSNDGVAEDQRNRRHLIALPDTARVISVDNKTMQGGYATIRKVRIEGCPGILPHWEFAAKKSNHYRSRPELAKLEHQNESMAVRIAHPGVIRFAVVHATSYEGYAYWWNGGTLRQMLNMDNNYPDNIQVRLMHSNPTEEEVVKAYRLKRFRKKRTELAWALVHIMNAVHIAGHLHNDLSPDNIMFHFPEDESCVYIGVCDWGMTTLATEPMKSLYTFISEKERTEALERRWWVDPEIAYLHKAGADVGIIPMYSRKSEEYAVGKLAQKINAQCMTQAYFELQRETPHMTKFPFHEFGRVFDLYLNRLCLPAENEHRSLAHVVHRFCGTYHWPIPDEHFRRSY
ncbi:MAG: hypothetical protein IMZ40_01335 [Bacilli bacterium]|nr:hypothetical protein [Bacilli bacterium]